MTDETFIEIFACPDCGRRLERPETILNEWPMCCGFEMVLMASVCLRRYRASR